MSLNLLCRPARTGNAVSQTLLQQIQSTNTSLRESIEGWRSNESFRYLDDLARHEGQLLCRRLVVGGHGSRVVGVKSHEESHGGDGHLARGLQLPLQEVLRGGHPHLIGEDQNVQLQPRLHLQPRRLLSAWEDGCRRQQAAPDPQPNAR